MKKCCRTCKHCQLDQLSTSRWCHIRGINVHSDIATFVVCHHWTKSAPSLPKIHDQSSQVSSDLQLELNNAVLID